MYKLQLKVCIALVYIIAQVLLFGCSSSSIGSNIEELSISDIVSKVVYQDPENYQIEISFSNPTEYQFNPMGVFVKPSFKNQNGNKIDMGMYPLALEAKLIDGSGEKYTYKAEVPKKILSIYPQSQKNVLGIEIRGYFLKNDETFKTQDSWFESEVNLNK